MRADCFHEPQRLPGDLSVEIETALVCVIEVVQMPLNGELNVPARGDLTAQNGVVADAVGMVSGCHAGDVDFGHREQVTLV